MSNRIWIELDKPKDKTFAEEQCRLVNNMLTRLADPEHLPLQGTFYWSAHEAQYCYGGNNGYIVLMDRGHWLNLDYLGRPVVYLQGD